MEQYYSYGAPPSMTERPLGYNYRPLNNGRIWYTAVMPLLAVYIQSYATSFRLGVLVWAASAAMWVFSLLADRRYLESEGYDVSGLSPFLALIPPVYMTKRYSMLGQRSSAPIVFVMVFVFALYANGFTRYATLKDNSYTDYVKYENWTDISEIRSALGDFTSEKNIGNSLKAYAKSEPDSGKMSWSVKKDGVNVTVTASCKEKDFEAVFSFTYDGFSSGATKLTALRLDGKEYKDKEAAEKLAEIIKALPEDSSSSEDSPQQ